MADYIDQVNVAGVVYDIGGSSTDEKVKQSTSNTNATFPLLASAQTSPTSGTAYEAIYDTNININPNLHSVAEGMSSTASGQGSHAEGGYRMGTAPLVITVNGGTASGKGSHAEGGLTEAAGLTSHAEGNGSQALGDYSHAEGFQTYANQLCSHAEGHETFAGYIGDTKYGAHAEGFGHLLEDGESVFSTLAATGQGSHAWGYTADTRSYIEASADGSFAGGYADGNNDQDDQNACIWASNPGDFAFGYVCSYDDNNDVNIFSSIAAEGGGSLAYGYSKANQDGDSGEGSISATGMGSTACGYSLGAQISASNSGSFAGGLADDYPVIASGLASFAYGHGVKATGEGAHAEGIGTTASNIAAHAEGSDSTASGQCSHAEGYSTASGNYSHSEGYDTTASSTYSHAEGYGTKASGSGSHAEGYSSTAEHIYASANGSHAGGYAASSSYIYASGSGSFAHGYGTSGSLYASGTGSFAGGVSPVYVSKEGAFAWGNNIQISQGGGNSGNYSSAFGIYHNIQNRYCTAIGRCSAVTSLGDLFVIGNGTGGNALSTQFKVHNDSNTDDGGSTVTVTVTGRVNATQGFFQTSDKRQKNILGDLDLNKAYALIDKCQTILYTLKEDESNKQDIGLIAQEVQEFFPEIVNVDDKGMLSLDYAKLTVVILKVLKDLIARVSKLEEK